jgi:hypothetical protein
MVEGDFRVGVAFRFLVTEVGSAPSGSVGGGQGGGG